MSVCDPVTGMHSVFTGRLPVQFFAPQPAVRFGEEWDDRDFAPMAEIIEQHHEELAAVIVEPIVQGAGGMWFYHPEYLRRLREMCTRYDILLIADEIATGFGRTGFWFALDDYDYTPDIISFAKGCNSGYVPAGGVIMSDPVAHRFDDIVFPGGLTYSGHPLAMGAIVATQEAMEEEHIVDNAYTIGKDVLGPQLTALYDKHPKIGEVRGKGVFWAVEMVADRTPKEPLADALALAREIGLPMLKTPYTMFEACARLYTAGLRPVELG